MPKGHGLQRITVFTLLFLKSISSNCPCFSGTVPVLWIVNNSVGWESQEESKKTMDYTGNAQQNG